MSEPMLRTDLERVITTVCRRARRQGSVSADDVRSELVRAGLPEARWVEVVSSAGDMLSNRDGRYHYCPAAVTSRREQRRQRRLNRAVRELIRGYKSSALSERRRQGRIDFTKPGPDKSRDFSGAVWIGRLPLFLDFASTHSLRTPV